MIKHRTDSITIEVTFEDENNTKFDPDSQEHKIFDPEGTEKVTLIPTKQSLGVFRVTYSIPADAAFGDWVLISKGVKGTYVESEPFYFTVQRKSGE